MLRVAWIVGLQEDAAVVAEKPCQATATTMTTRPKLHLGMQAAVAEAVVVGCYLCLQLRLSKLQKTIWTRQARAWLRPWRSDLVCSRSMVREEQAPAVMGEMAVRGRQRGREALAVTSATSRRCPGSAEAPAV